MKWIFPGLVLFTLLTLLAWPYVYVYRLDRAVAAGDLPSLAELVDLEAVRAGLKGEISERVERTIGGGEGALLGLLREGVERIGGRTIDATIDLEWVYQRLRSRNRDVPPPDPSLLSEATHAFFTSPRRFLLRTGAPGAALHVELSLREGRWLVTWIYD